jgi:serine/threonine protein kinase
MDSIAHYNLLERIGEGGIGEVFRARDMKVGRTVALKRIGPAIAGNPARLARFFEDARAAMALSHPNIATLFDAGEGDGVPYLAYEFAAGHTLREECGGASMNPRRAIDLAIQIADGVADAHSHGIIHGDLRPETIIVTGKGSAKILDFGLAPWTKGGDVRALAAQAPDGVPAESKTILEYLSPEQAIGSAVDVRTDVFTLGTLTYEMLTGRNPFTGSTAAQTVMNVIQARVPPASELNAAVPRTSIRSSPER